MYRTPSKSASPSANKSSTAGSVEVSAESESLRSNVRRSIGEWEAGKSVSRSSLSPPNKTFTVGSPKQETVASRLSAGTSGGPPTKAAGKTSGRLAEARACLLKAKLHLSNSRNLKTEIKNAVQQAVDRLYQLVKESESDKTQSSFTQPQVRGEDEMTKEGVSPSPSSRSSLEEVMRKHMVLLEESTSKVTSLGEALDRMNVAGGHDDLQSENIGKLLGEVQELRRTSEDTGKRVSSLQETLPSYAEVLARPKSMPSPIKQQQKHSVIVSSCNEMDTSDEVLGKVREALEAKTAGLQVTRVQKVRNQKVVLSCASKAELLKVTEKLASKTKGLSVEEAKNKDPLVIIKNLLTFNKDAEIVSSLRSQNKNLLGDLRDDEFRATVKYRRRARNPHENHVVMQVSPKLWLKLTEAGRVHVDLQYAAVQDQSPLVQCTRCLGYGHGRRLCTESADLCSYCAGPHLRVDCPVVTAGGTASCRNCRLAKCPDFSHNAFDGECPVRKRWDAIARSSVAYC